MSPESKSTWPESGWSVPAICPMSVVLPAPFGPISACTSPARTKSEAPSVAATPPKRLLSARSSSIAISRSGRRPPRGEESRDSLRGKQHDREQDRAHREATVLLVVGRERG